MKAFIIAAQTLDAYTVLPRIALHFSRRRLHIDRLEMKVDEHNGTTRFEIELRCEGGMLEKLLKQLQRIVELQEISAREKLVVRGVAA